MNKEFFEDCFGFLAPFTNLNQIFLREKKNIENHVCKVTTKNREEAYKQLRKEIKDDFEEFKDQSVPIKLVACCMAWLDVLVNEIEECQQEIATYQGCIVQTELAFLKGQIISMINPNGKMADYGKPAIIKN